MLHRKCHCPRSGFRCWGLGSGFSPGRRGRRPRPAGPSAPAGSRNSRGSARFPAWLSLPGGGALGRLLGHRGFRSHDRGGGDFIAPAGSSLKRLGSLPCPSAVLAECLEGPGAGYTFLSNNHTSGNLPKGTNPQKQKREKGSLPSVIVGRDIYSRRSWAPQVRCNCLVET